MDTKTYALVKGEIEVTTTQKKVDPTVTTVTPTEDYLRFLNTQTAAITYQRDTQIAQLQKQISDLTDQKTQEIADVATLTQLTTDAGIVLTPDVPVIPPVTPPTKG